MLEYTNSLDGAQMIIFLLFGYFFIKNVLIQMVFDEKMDGPMNSDLCV